MGNCQGRCGGGAGCCSALCARAMEIADEAMEGLLACHAVRLDGDDAIAKAAGRPGALFALVNEAQQPVSRLADADAAIIEAFEWLSARGMAELLPGEHGEAIRLARPHDVAGEGSGDAEHC